MKQYYVIPTLLSLLALFWMYMGVTAYEVWDEGPGGGFMPLIAGGVLLVFSVVSLIKVDFVSLHHSLYALMPVAIVAALIGAIPIVGTFPALFIMLLLWLALLAGYSWRFSFVVSAGVLGVVWLIFGLWLSVPFPTGLFY